MRIKLTLILIELKIMINMKANNWKVFQYLIVWIEHLSLSFCNNFMQYFWENNIQLLEHSAII